MDVLRTLLAIAPLILQLIRAAEEALPAGGNGSQKLELVRTWLEQAFGTLGDTGDVFAQLWPRIKAMIDATVAVANALGWFKRAGQPTQ